MSTGIQACPDDCPAPHWSKEGLKWCSFDVQKPHTDWKTVDERAGTKDSERRVSVALQDVQVCLVQHQHEVAPSLAALYDSMTDFIVGIDTEWKPDDRNNDNDVAMVQLATSTMVLLVRTCTLGGLPQEVIDFCRDDEVVGVGFAWTNSDENKMLDSFDLGCRDLFTHFIDVRAQAEMMGYHDYSVGTLAGKLLGFHPPASKQITLSNWEAKYLEPRQLKYAALDALITGDLFRGLRALHASPFPCRGCPLAIGLWPGVLDRQCQHPECVRKKAFPSVKSLLDHMKKKNHQSNVSWCAECGRASSTDGVIELGDVHGQIEDDKRAVERERMENARPVPEEQYWHNSVAPNLQQHGSNNASPIYERYETSQTEYGSRADGSRGYGEQRSASSQWGRQAPSRSHQKRRDQQIFRAYNNYGAY